MITLMNNINMLHKAHNNLSLLTCIPNWLAKIARSVLLVNQLILKSGFMWFTTIARCFLPMWLASIGSGLLPMRLANSGKHLLPIWLTGVGSCLYLTSLVARSRTGTEESKSSIRVSRVACTAAPITSHQLSMTTRVPSVWCQCCSAQYKKNCITAVWFECASL